MPSPFGTLAQRMFGYTPEMRPVPTSFFDGKIKKPRRLYDIIKEFPADAEPRPVERTAES